MHEYYYIRYHFVRKSDWTYNGPVSIKQMMDDSTIVEHKHKSNLYNELHMRAAQVHGTAIDVVEHHLHVISLSQDKNSTFKRHLNKRKIVGNFVSQEDRMKTRNYKDPFYKSQKLLVFFKMLHRSLRQYSEIFIPCLLWN